MPNSSLKPISVSTLEQFLINNIIVTDSDDGITSIRIDVQDPELGKYILFKLDKVADDIIKKRILNRSLSYTKFLNNKLISTLNKDQRQSLINAIAIQEQTQMLASTYLPFAAEKFGEIYSSKRANKKPNITSVLLIYLVSGIMIGVLSVLFLGYFKNK